MKKLKLISKIVYLTASISWFYIFILFCFKEFEPSRFLIGESILLSAFLFLVLYDSISYKD